MLIGRFLIVLQPVRQFFSHKATLPFPVKTCSTLSYARHLRPLSSIEVTNATYTMSGAFCFGGLIERTTSIKWPFTTTKVCCRYSPNVCIMITWVVNRDLKSSKVTYFLNSHPHVAKELSGIKVLIAIDL